MSEQVTPVTPAPVKAGFWTSEFFLHAIAAIGGIVLSSGILGNGEVGQAAGSVLTLTSVTHWGYIRNSLKTIAIHAGVAALKATVAEIKEADAKAAAEEAK